MTNSSFLIPLLSEPTPVRPAAVHYMLPAVPAYGEPLVFFEQKPARKFVAAVLIVLLLVLFVLYSPFYMLMSAAFADQGLLKETFSERPRALVQILAGFSVWLIFIGTPIYFLFDTLTRSRRVQIAQGIVTVTDRAFGFTKTWQSPISAYLGVKQAMRAFISGVRHELILVHPDAQRSIVLLLSHNVKDLDGMQIAADLGTRLLGSPEQKEATASIKLVRTASA